MWDKPQAVIWFANLLYGLAAMLLLYALLFMLVHLPIFPIREIRMDGTLSHVSRDQVQYIVSNELKGTFFTVNLDTTRKAFEKLPWVRRVDIRRTWPDRLDIVLEEHHALARWVKGGLINRQGERFDAASSQVLPLLDGPEGTEKEMADGYLMMVKMFEQVKRQPVRVWLSPRRAWRVQLDNAMMLELGRDQLRERLNKFVAVYPQVLSSSHQSVGHVDLRYPNGFAVRSAPTSKKHE